MGSHPDSMFLCSDQSFGVLFCKAMDGVACWLFCRSSLLETLEIGHLTYLFKSCILINWIMMQARMQPGSAKGVLSADKDT